MTHIPLYLCSSSGFGAARFIEQSYVMADGSRYAARYEYRRQDREGHWMAVLTNVEEVLPPMAPHVERVRLPMMESGAFSVRLEAQQRRREWAEWSQQLSARANLSSNGPDVPLQVM